ncbi:heterokaryon incompatibility protein-domain-containing protein [Xylariaceae sp. FL0594]|nr:heterokaryon incompatibility protein-domain-containing protein [Xylariaceae sp. FL0594]
MWLINTRTYELESITNPDPASYAILSHTWQDDEVSFQDYQKLGKLGRLRGLREALSKIRSKKVLQKVFKTVQMARSRGLRYAWVDTCCIDKSSSAELSEAINSMFRWYENAAVCFTYLADLPSLKQLRKKYSEAEFDELLQGQNGFFFSCRWFKRGWTLQELIAPRNVEFYDCEWNEYGKRTLLWEPIRAITKIPVEVLDKSASLQSIPVAQRMSWAAHRSTTRVEDMAYCLLGIFDLNMTLLYGEGSKAFIRLQEEICRQSTDLSLFAWRAHDSWPLYRGIFASSPWEFNECHSLVPERGRLGQYVRKAVMTGTARMLSCL